MALSFDQLSALADRPVTTVHVDAWNDDVYVRLMDGPERDSFAALLDDKKASNAAIRRAILGRGLSDEAGNRPDAKTVELIVLKSGVALEQLMAQILELNGMTKESREKLLGKQESSSSEETNSSG